MGKKYFIHEPYNNSKMLNLVPLEFKMCFDNN